MRQKKKEWEKKERSSNAGVEPATSWSADTERCCYGITAHAHL